jgi:hypothetical protein
VVDVVEKRGTGFVCLHTRTALHHHHALFAPKTHTHTKKQQAERLALASAAGLAPGAVGKWYTNRRHRLWLPHFHGGPLPRSAEQAAPVLRAAGVIP